MKKIFSSLILISMVFSACAPAAPEPVEVEFWHSLKGAYGEVLDELIEEYNNTNQKDITVVGVYQGNYQDTQKALMAELAAGGSPDVAQLEASFSATMVAAGALRPMQDFIDDADVVGYFNTLKYLKYGEYNLSSNGKIISRFDFVKTYYDSLSYIKKNTPKILPIPTSAFNNIAIRPMYTALDFSKFENNFNLVLPDWQMTLDKKNKISI